MLTLFKILAGVLFGVIIYNLVDDVIIILKMQVLGILLDVQMNLI